MKEVWESILALPFFMFISLCLYLYVYIFMFISLCLYLYVYIFVPRNKKTPQVLPRGVQILIYYLTFITSLFLPHFFSSIFFKKIFTGFPWGLTTSPISWKPYFLLIWMHRGLSHLTEAINKGVVVCSRTA